MPCLFAVTKTDISPLLPVRLVGFAPLRTAEKLHDPIYARILYFRDEKETLLLELDWVGFDKAFLEILSAAVKIPVNQIIACASHTHSGPEGTIKTDCGTCNGLKNVFGNYNEDYVHSCAEKIAREVEQCRIECEPFEWRWMKTQLSGVGSERHDPAFNADEDLLVLEFKTAKKKALLYRLSCHPTVLNGSNTLVSADFPGAVERAFSDYDAVCFLNGSCGDMSTRFTRKGTDFNELDRYADIIRSAIIKLQEDNKPWRTDFEVHVQQHLVPVEVRAFDNVEEAKQKLTNALKEEETAKAEGRDPMTVRLIASLREGAETNLSMSQNFKNISSIEVTVTLIKINELTLIGTPVELFSKLSNPLKTKETIEFIGYCNGYHLYMADEDAYDHEYYEAKSSPFAKGAGETLMKQIQLWIQ